MQYMYCNNDNIKSPESPTTCISRSIAIAGGSHGLGRAAFGPTKGRLGLLKGSVILNQIPRVQEGLFGSENGIWAPPEKVDPRNVAEDSGMGIEAHSRISPWDSMTLDGKEGLSSPGGVPGPLLYAQVGSSMLTATFSWAIFGVNKVTQHVACFPLFSAITANDHPSEDPDPIATDFRVYLRHLETHFWISRSFLNFWSGDWFRSLQSPVSLPDGSDRRTAFQPIDAAISKGIGWPKSNVFFWAWSRLDAN